MLVVLFGVVMPIFLAISDLLQNAAKESDAVFPPESDSYVRCVCGIHSFRFLAEVASRPAWLDHNQAGAWRRFGGGGASLKKRDALPVRLRIGLPMLFPRGALPA